MVNAQVLFLQLQSRILLFMQAPGMGDPGMPGGDPDLPETPLDSGVIFLIVVALAYGCWRLRRSTEVSNR